MDKEYINKKEINNKSIQLPGILSKAAFFILATLATQGRFSCSDSKDKQEIHKDILELMKKNHVGTFTNTIELKITDDNNDQEEKVLYKEAFLAFENAKSKIRKLGIYPTEEIDFHRFLPLMIKESRLDENAISTSKAIWYFQLKDPAIADVNTMLTWEGIDVAGYSPKTNSDHNIIYGVSYFLKTAEQLKNKYPDIQDMDNFVYASYNAGVNKIITLIEESGAESRDEFVKYVTDDLMWLSWDSKEIDSPYGCKVRNFFGEKDFSKDSTEVFRKEWDFSTIVLVKSKAQEFVRYVETINGISNFIDHRKCEPEIYKFMKVNEWSTLFKSVTDMKKNGSLGIKEGNNIVDLCNDIALDNNMDPDKIPANAFLVITKNLMEEFDYADTNKYAYDKIAYDKETKSFLGKIIKKKMQDEKFYNNIVRKIPQLSVLEDSQDKEFYIINAVIHFNESNRRWRSTTSSEDVRIPTDPIFYTNYIDQQEQGAKDMDDDQEQININGIYIDPSMEKIWGELTYIWNFAESEMTNIENTFIQKIWNKQINKKDKMINPKYIIVHSTAGNIGDIPWVKAHFFVSKEWIIYKLTDKKGTFRQLNHAGFWTTWSWAIWSNDKNISYKSLGIEVEASGGERWNEKEYEAVKKLISYLWRKYKISKKNVLAHSQVAFSSVWRWRKQDPYYVNRSKLWLPDNYKEIDKDVAKGKSPNMNQFIKELQEMWLTDSEIKNYLSWIDAWIRIVREKKIKKINAQDKNARKTSSELLD